MKVHNLALVAAATLIFGAQGVAQSDNGLERALTELNAGLTAPAGSAGMAISGDLRVKNAMTIGGSTKDWKSADVRARLNFDFNVNESVNAHIGTNVTEYWDNDAANVDTDADLDNTSMETAYVTVANLLGDGGTFKIGRDYWTMGSGRIEGSDDWDAAPSTRSGAWYSNAGFSAWLLNDGAADDGDDIGFSWDYAMAIPGMGDVTLRPYYLVSAAGADGSTGFNSNGYGSEFTGSIAGFGLSGEFANDQDGGNAYAVETSIEVGMLNSLPGVDGGSLDMSFSKADADFGLAQGSGLHWGKAGYAADGLGVWDTENGEREVNSIGMSFSPMEGWNGSLSRFDVDGSSSWNMSMGTTLAGAVDTAVYVADGDDGNAVWLTMSVNF